MGCRCWVPYCNSGYDSNPEKISSFKVPRGMLDAWQKAINRTDRKLTYCDHICAKHFAKDAFQSHMASTDPNGEILLEVAPKKLTLLPNAVPTIFPTGPYASKLKSQLLRKKSGNASSDESVSRKKVKLSSKTARVKKCKRIKKVAQNSDTEDPANAAVVVLTADTIATSAVTPNDLENSYEYLQIVDLDCGDHDYLKGASLADVLAHEDFNFKDLLENIDSVALPNCKWVKFVFETGGKNIIVFAEAIMIKGKNSRLAISRQLTVTEADVSPAAKKIVCQAFVWNYEVPFCSYLHCGKIASLDDLQSALYLFAKRMICKGGPKKANGLGIGETYVDETNVVRHNKCTLLCDSPAVRCQHCETLDKQRSSISKQRKTDLSSNLAPNEENLKEELESVKQSRDHLAERNAELEEKLASLEEELVQVRSKLNNAN